MAKKTHLDKVIEQLDGEIAVLMAAKARLVQQQLEVLKGPKRRGQHSEPAQPPPLRRAQAKALVEMPQTHSGRADF